MLRPVEVGLADTLMKIGTFLFETVEGAVGQCDIAQAACAACMRCPKRR